MIEKIKTLISKTIRFLTYDIWRMSSKDISKIRSAFYDIIKSFVLAFRNIDSSIINSRAAALTYSTLLAIVPLLAVLFAIGRGFGFQNIVKSQLFSFFSGQKDVLVKVEEIIEKSIEYAQGGVFLGIGVVMLLYTVINLLSNIEANFNRIWRIQVGRTYFRVFTDYLALIIVLPVFLVCNGGLAILLSSTQDLKLVGIFASPMMKVVSFGVIILLFTFLISYIPNTKVRFTSALVGGVFTGIVFQIFQLLYISGQIWISKYNAIYGGFAALPLLLLWMQISWFITLIGVELSYAYQNVNKFDFDYETTKTSRRYKDFVLLVMMSLIVKRFEKGEKPYTGDELSAQHKIPTRLTSDSIFYLQEIGLIVETRSDEDLVPAYIPAIDINKISVSYLFERIALHGSEDFRIDKDVEFKSEWETILNIKRIIHENKGNKLLKDI